MNVTEVKHVKKGVVALFALTLIGASAPVYVSAQSETDASQWMDASNTSSITTDSAYSWWAESFVNETAAFQTNIIDYGDAAKTSLEAIGGEDDSDFNSAFIEASSTYDESVVNAGDQFKWDIQTASSTAESKDQFIDAFNNAKATYFNSVDQAKNNYANALSTQGDTANQIKDTFIGHYNSAHDAYSNETEAIKNDFAADIG